MSRKNYIPPKITLERYLAYIEEKQVLEEYFEYVGDLWLETQPFGFSEPENVTGIERIGSDGVEFYTGYEYSDGYRPSRLMPLGNVLGPDLEKWKKLKTDREAEKAKKQKEWQRAQYERLKKEFGDE